MIRSAPSISTTGPAGPLERPEVGERRRPRARRAGCSRALVVAGLGEDVDGGRHVGCRGHARRGPPSRVQARPARRSSSCRGGSIVTSRTGSPRCCWTAQAPRPQAQPVLRARRGRVLPRLARRPRRSAGSPRTSTATSTSSRTTTGACSASSSARTTRRRRGALLDAAEAWLRERGRDRMVGPMDFTTNDECGLLVEGYDRAADHPHDLAPPLLPGAARGRRPGQGDGPVHVGALHQRAASASTRRSGRWPRRSSPSTGSPCGRCASATSRPRSARFLEVYNAAWEHNWGFVPLTEEEVRHYAKDLKPVLDENWAMIAETRDGEVVGAALTLPDFNQVLAHLNGRLLPFGWAKALYWRRKIDRVRVFALGRQARVPAHRRRRAHSTSCTSTRPSARRRRAARWAGSSRPTRR